MLDLSLKELRLLQNLEVLKTIKVCLKIITKRT